jgi:hypothetical protein
MQLTTEEYELMAKLLRGCADNKSMPDRIHAIAERILAKLNSEFTPEAAPDADVT